ncbi:MAG: helix-turn-helix domain-containing protein [Cyanobacteria bacterium J06627_15]
MEPLSKTAKPIVVAPGAALRNYVSHYWFSPGCPESVFTALPDGSVDVVLQIDAIAIQSWAYGTPTCRIDIPLNQDCHYVGIRFQAGQSRHFMEPSARHLTDTYATAFDILRFPLRQVVDQLPDQSPPQIGRQLNQLLEQHLGRHAPIHQTIDDAICCIQASRGTVAIHQVAEDFGCSRRHFERIFLETVGIPAKTFAKIIRFHHAVRLMTGAQQLPLAQIAAELNYTDQSHLTRDFKNLTGVPPTRFDSTHVAFLQDDPSPEASH